MAAPALSMPDAAVVDAAPAWRMLAWLGAAELLGMSLWFSATAVTPSLVEAFRLSSAESAWLTMAVQGGFVVGTLAGLIVLRTTGIATRFIEPASPWQNGVNESFNGRFRDECLNREPVSYTHLTLPTN